MPPAPKPPTRPHRCAARHVILPALLALLCLPLSLKAADAEALWKEIAALDAGPGQPPTDTAAARQHFFQHVLKQEESCRKFLVALGEPSKDPRLFEARLRLARALALHGELGEGSDSTNALAAAERLFDFLLTNGNQDQRAEVNFSRITQWMRRNRLPDHSQRAPFLDALKEFAREFPTDRRIPTLFVEAASVFDRDPDTKKFLLNEALRLNKDPRLEARIADDQKRLSLLGKPLQLKFSTFTGDPFDLQSLKGRPVIILFFAPQSPASRLAVKKVADAMKAFPTLARIGVCMEPDRGVAERFRSTQWSQDPLWWDGRGWETNLMRRLGINAVPTAWLIDANGTLISLDALEDTNAQIKACLH
jgi:hypothetical protein